MRRFSRFVVVGGIGFVVDASLLWLFAIRLDLGPFAGRGLSFAAAVTATWILNRRYTFRDRGSDRRGREAARYLAAQLVGNGINLLVYSAVVKWGPALEYLPLYALVLASGTAMMANYVMADRIVFVRR